MYNDKYYTINRKRDIENEFWRQIIKIKKRKKYKSRNKYINTDIILQSNSN